VWKLGDSLSEEDIRARLESHLDARLMVELDGHYLSVAVWRNRAERELPENMAVIQSKQEPQPVFRLI